MVKLLDVVERHFLEVDESDDDIRDLHTCIVDVILNLHSIACCFENANERVSEHGVPHMANVCSFVGIDAGVLDHLFWTSYDSVILGGNARRRSCGEHRQQLCAIKEDV